MRIGDWIERWALVEPGREALVDADRGRRYRYADLHARILAAETWLRAGDVEVGDRVAVLARNRVEHVDLFFACARLGAILVPVNWRLAGPEVAHVLSDSAPRFLLVEEALRGLAGGWSGEILALPEEGAPWVDADAEPAPRAASPARPHEGGPAISGDRDERPVMILYTSGTTGKPKGAVLTQASVYWNSVNTCLSWDLSAQDSTLTHTPFFHAGGWHVLTTPLLHRGGRVVLVGAFDADRALELVEEERLSLLFAVPTMFEMMIRSECWSSSELSSLRFAITGGASCAAEVSAAFKTRGVRFKQGYGLTEAGPNCFTISLDDGEARPGSVGFPIHNVEARVIDPEGSDVGPDEVGELLLRGPHICAGYWRRPDATAEAIRDGWLHTGDLVRRDTEGFTYIVGRRKEMFISGGENVYPAEIERVLERRDGVRQVAVIGVPDERWGEVGAAFVVPEAGGLTPEVLLAYCREHLARYKVPKHFRVEAELPLTPSGKIAKKVLTEKWTK